MGWAKYMEDDLEIANERQSLLAKRRTHSETGQAAPMVTVCIAPVVVAKESPIAVKRKKKKIRCKDCGEVFTFSVRDQLFYEKMGWEPPKRCKICREHRKIRHLMNLSY